MNGTVVVVGAGLCFVAFGVGTALAHVHIRDPRAWLYERRQAPRSGSPSEGGRSNG